MRDFFTTLISGIGINDVFDILITTFIIYKILGFIRETRAMQLVRGLLIVVIAYILSIYLQFNTIHWILRSAFTIGIFGLIVVFQPELRRGLEVMGRSKFRSGYGAQTDEATARKIIEQIRNAVMTFSEERTGALIVFEREISLEDVAETGTIVNADITEQLLGNLFYEGSPLHDGAVIVRGSQIYAAGCILPLTQNKNLNKSLGMRHRAGIGITENSDARVVIVSEETGIISLASEGRIRRYFDEPGVEQILEDLYLPKKNEEKQTLWQKLTRKKKEEAR